MSGGRKIVLASASAIRARILSSAGIAFETQKPAVDETALKRACAKDGLSLEDTAMALARAKALSVKAGDACVIGADQILEFEGRGHDKPRSMDEARARLLELQGRAHALINAVAVARAGEIVWRRMDRATLFMRTLSGAEIDAYLSAAGENILTSVGAYQIEKLGSRLFERIEGEHFAVLGLNLFPLLEALRREGALAF